MVLCDVLIVVVFFFTRWRREGSEWTARTWPMLMNSRSRWLRGPSPGRVGSYLDTRYGPDRYYMHPLTTYTQDITPKFRPNSGLNPSLVKLPKFCLLCLLNLTVETILHHMHGCIRYSVIKYRTPECIKLIKSLKARHWFNNEFTWKYLTLCIKNIWYPNIDI